jgi:hypothetical protein
MISAVHLPAFNYGRDTFAVVLCEMARGTLPLADKTAAMVLAGILHQTPDGSRLPVDLRLIVLNRRRAASCSLVPALLELFTTILLRIRR